MEEKKIRPQDKWNAKACEKSGVSQAGQLSKMMKQYIEEVEASK